MPRPSQLLHPQREPAPTRPAATVLLLRDDAQGMQVLMTRRSATASFAPGAYVFPGGTIDHGDALAHAQSTRRPTQNDAQLTQAIAAIRESFEELGVLLARHADGRPATAADMAALDRAAPLAAQCAARGLTLAAADVFTLAHWITDRDLPRRFDVAFLVARMPEGQTPVADEAEQFEPVWVRPADALARHAAGQFFMIFPTLRTLERLQAYPDVASVLAACAGEQPLWTSCPRAGWLAGEDARCMEHEAPFGELALVTPDGQQLHHLDWQSRQPVPLLKNVERLTAAPRATGSSTSSARIRTPTIRPAPSRCRRCAATPSRPSWAWPRAPRPAPPASSRPTGSYKIMSAWRWLRLRQRAKSPTRCARCSHPAMPRTTCASCWKKTACCSAATTS